MTDSFGLKRLRGKFSDTTKIAVENMHDLHKLVVKTETAAADAKDQLDSENIIYNKAVTVRNDLDALIVEMDVKRSKATEFAEFAIDAYIDAARLKRQFMEFKKRYDGSVSMTLALMSEPYILSIILETQETADRVLNQIGEDRIADWLKRKAKADSE